MQMENPPRIAAGLDDIPSVALEREKKLRAIEVPCFRMPGGEPGPRQALFQRAARPALETGSAREKPGEMLQMDHLSAMLYNGAAVKDFKAVCPQSKYLAQGARSRAAADIARAFSLRVIEQMPFPLPGVQMDGGSEFLADFERACQELHIQLFALPPRRPQIQRRRRAAQPRRARGVLFPASGRDGPGLGQLRTGRTSTSV